MKKVILSFYLLCLVFAKSAWGIDLGDAKTQGLVGETPTGYLAAVTTPSAEIKSLIADINSKRKSHYQKIANENGTSLEAIEKVAGETATKKTLAGNFIQVNGQWKKK
ncbi:MAG: DUF1318 domain-containing protein [Gammaproteobacteria bacterium]|nr:DUF1318 domain-containing protein [Gammaproteobacteria bacterium]